MEAHTIEDVLVLKGGKRAPSTTSQRSSASDLPMEDLGTPKIPSAKLSDRSTTIGTGLSTGSNEPITPAIPLKKVVEFEQMDKVKKKLAYEDSFDSDRSIAQETPEYDHDASSEEKNQVRAIRRAPSKQEKRRNSDGSSSSKAPPSKITNRAPSVTFHSPSIKPKAAAPKPAVLKRGCQYFFILLSRGFLAFAARLHSAAVDSRDRHAHRVVRRRTEAPPAATRKRNVNTNQAPNAKKTAAKPKQKAKKTSKPSVSSNRVPKKTNSHANPRSHSLSGFLHVFFFLGSILEEFAFFHFYGCAIKRFAIAWLCFPFHGHLHNLAEVEKHRQRLQSC